ncbi:MULTISPECIES: Crp/Fnr family transcriptional regulator [Clostridium]|uniref:Global nitrogen regulator n=2 Tax=Clostridium TaxID=1485 RepID=A0A151AP07_9CLOT|nr:MULTISPECIES: Crp/Fnr family transcriptional regulator [Clostridium]KYH29358.1 global nitrogen regulator [Clostridium colicanis DSM 13634]MBE6043114.1 Crp/Fnr family transcriptional regulator [Clostridium thermopalmarium]PRR70860.1 Global nitrogen regulator [Clostridium thermopalmarium DSM 5974]PVZ28784.1 CRP-like cAMP-binding protein [Clostridium thermopalmarium DSM 5974]
MIKVTGKDLLGIPMFSKLQKSTLQELERIGYKLNLKKGEKLFLERDNVDNIYVVLKGKVTMYRSNQEGQKKVIYILDEGQFINEVILDRKSASISCEAFEPSEIISFQREELLNVMEKDFDLTKQMLDMMAKKIRRLYRQLKNTVPIKMDRKVAAKLWKLSRDYGVEVEDGTLINLKITITYLADMLGSPRETISRAVKVLEEKGMVKYRDRKMIVNTEKLAKYYREL